MAYMQFNTEDDDQDCVAEILRICKANTTSYPLKEIARRFNHALDRYFALAFQADGRWPYDDINETGPPIDTQNIVSGTNRYKIGTFTEKIIKVIRIEVLNSNGTGVSLVPETFNNLNVVRPGNRSGVIGGSSQDTFQELYVNASSGTPSHYCKYGDFIYLRPNPNYSETDGLKIYFNRSATHMASTDTTAIAGVPEIHIYYLCRMAALPYLIENSKASAGAVASQIAQDEAMISEYFANRDKDIPARIIPNIEDCR